VRKRTPCSASVRGAEGEEPLGLDAGGCLPERGVPHTGLVDSAAVNTALAAAVTPLLGQRPWGARQMHGSFLNFDFGLEVLTSGGYTHGVWNLWVEMAAWRIESGPQVLAACEDDRKTIAAALQ
jgi:hypothetical protein